MYSFLQRIPDNCSPAPALSSTLKRRDFEHGKSPLQVSGCSCHAPIHRPGGKYRCCHHERYHVWRTRANTRLAVHILSPTIIVSRRNVVRANSYRCFPPKKRNPRPVSNVSGSGRLPWLALSLVLDGREGSRRVCARSLRSLPPGTVSRMMSMGKGKKDRLVVQSLGNCVVKRAMALMRFIVLVRR